MDLEQERVSKPARGCTSADIQSVRRRRMTLANLPENALAQKRAVLKSIWGSQKLVLALDEALRTSAMTGSATSSWHSSCAKGVSGST
jgi:hypothetical protein